MKTFHLFEHTLGMFVNETFLVKEVGSETPLPEPVDRSRNPEITTAIVLKSADVAITVNGTCKHLEEDNDNFNLYVVYILSK